MENTPTDVNPGADTPAGGQPEQTNPSNEPAPKPSLDGGEPEEGGTSPDSKDDKRIVDAERFNQLLEDSKKLKTLESEFATSKQDMQNKLDAIAAAAQGKTQEQIDSDAEKMAQKWGVPPEFVTELFSVATDRATKQLDEKLKPLRVQQAQSNYDREFNALVEKFPAAADMSEEERSEFRKLAIDQKYRSVPLEDLWKIQNYGKPEGKRKSAEPSRGGSRSFNTDEPDITEMSLDEFEKYSNDLAKK